MKKLITIVLLACSFYSFSQPVNPRSNSSVTVMDSRWMGQFNAFMPRYFDTTAANLQKGVDSCGAIIYTYLNNTVYVRGCSPKRWIALAGGGGGSGFTTADNGLTANTATNVQDGGTLLKNTIKSGINTYTYKFDSLTSFTVNALGGSANSSLRMVNDGTIELAGGNARLRYQGDTIISDTRAGYVTNINGSLTTNSWITKSYFDSLKNIGSVTVANNLLTLSGATVQFGGTATQNNTAALGTTSLDWTSGGAMSTNVSPYKISLTPTSYSGTIYNGTLIQVSGTVSANGKKVAGLTVDNQITHSSGTGQNIGARFNADGGPNGGNFAIIVDSGWVGIGEDLPGSKLWIRDNNMKEILSGQSGIVMSNDSLPTPTYDQASPPITFAGLAWDSVGLTSRGLLFSIWNLPQKSSSSGSTPNGILKFTASPAMPSSGSTQVDIFGLDENGAMYLGGSNAGTANQVLISNGPHAAPTWGAAAIPTWDATLISGSTFTQAHTIAMAGFDFNFNNGQVGIGATPSYDLDVRANDAGLFAANVTNNSSTGSGMGINVFSTGTETILEALSGVGGSTSRFKVRSNGAIEFNGSAGTTGQVLTSAGSSSPPTWSAAGGSGVTTMAAIGSSPNANGATISGSTLNLQPADASFGGVVTTASQVIGGTKHFNTGIYVSGAKGLTPSVPGLSIENSGGTALIQGLSGAGGLADVILDGNTISIRQPAVAIGLYMNSAGKIGIGNNTTPSEALDITGNVRFSGALMPNNLPGTAGQVLTSGGAGNPNVWVNQSSIVGAVPTFQQVLATQSNSAIMTVNNDVNIRYGRVFNFITGGGPSAFLVTDSATGIITLSANTQNVTITSPDNSHLIAVENTSGILLSGTTTVTGSLGSTSIITSGGYTPNISGETNCTTTVNNLGYTRVGDNVTVFGKVEVDPTLTATSTFFDMDLPITSNFTNDRSGAGTGFCPTVVGMGLAIFTIGSDNKVRFQFVSSDINNNSFYFQFSYTIIP